MKSKPFNLLKPISTPKTSWDKLYDWINTNAKILMMFVIIAITFAFVLKVIVDTEAKNTNTEIEVLLNKVSFYSNNVETQSRDLIKKADIYKKQIKSQTNYHLILNELNSLFANSGNEFSIRIEEDNLSIYGNDDLSVLRSLETILRSSPIFINVKFDNLAIETIGNSRELGQYSLTAKIDKKFLILSRI
jgi:hypothetical protein